MYKFDDLTPYSYFDYFEKIKNVGWLDGDFPTAPPSNEFVEKLKKYGEFTTMQTRWWHECPYCPPAEAGKIKDAHCSNEIRVVGQHGEVYACPTLIIHYVEVHHYCPPQELWEAVMYGPKPGSPEYNAAIEEAKKSLVK